MERFIERYKREALRIGRGRNDEASADWKAVLDCWQAGRALFAQAFEKEVGKRLSAANIDDLLAQRSDMARRAAAESA